MSSIEQNTVKYFVVTGYEIGMNIALFQQVHTTTYTGKWFTCTGKPAKG
jgi:hypothetical protein